MASPVAIWHRFPYDVVREVAEVAWEDDELSESVRAEAGEETYCPLGWALGKIGKDNPLPGSLAVAFGLRPPEDPQGQGPATHAAKGEAAAFIAVADGYASFYGRKGVAAVRRVLQAALKAHPGKPREA